MAEPKGAKAAERARWPELAQEDDHTLMATWPLHRYRFMFSDGRTLDVLSPRDDSDLRGALLDHLGADAIVGVAQLPVE